MTASSRLFCLTTLALLTVGPAACSGEDGPGTGNENEVFTTITLTLTPMAGGSPVVAVVDDPDGDGGKAPTVQPIALSPGMFDMSVKFENRLAKPPENLTEEVEDEATQHQIFFTGNAVNGPASNAPGAPLTHTYADMDSKGLPLGVVNRITAAVGMGTLTVTLRHLPPINDVPQKMAGLADAVRMMGGFAGIAGSTDVQVTLPVRVQ